MREIVLELLPQRVSTATVRRLEKLLAEARKPGGPIGLAIVIQYPKRYVVDVVGQAEENLLITRAMVLDLQELIRERQLERR